jgi:hypothetical protein
MLTTVHCRKYLLYVLLGCLLVACSSMGELKAVSSATGTNLPARPSVRLVVNPVAKGSEEVISDIRAATLAQLLATGYFSRVVVAPEETDVVVTVNIVAYSRVTAGERFMWGALAGRNRIATQVKMVQTSTNVSIKSFEATGESGAIPLVSEAGLSDAVRELAKQIAAGAAL